MHNSSSTRSGSLVVPIMSSGGSGIITHRQRGGVCIGTVWCCIITSKNNHINNSKQQRSGASTFFISNLFRGSNAGVVDPCNIKNAVPMYCYLIGCMLYAYENEYEYIHGTTPIHIWTIVGASIWFPNHTNHRKKTTTAASTTTSTTGTTETSSSSTNTNTNTTTATATANSSSNFRFVTNQGTQVYCWTHHNYDCNVWLSSIHTGLQLAIQYNDITPAVMPVVPPILPKIAVNNGYTGTTTTTTTSTSTSTNTHQKSSPLSSISTSAIRYCRVCGVLAASNVHPAATTLSIVDPNFYSTTTANQQQQQQQQQQEHYIPLIQYGIEDKYGPLGSDNNGPASPSSTNHRSSSSSSSSSQQYIMNMNNNPNYYVCTNCNIAQGVVQYILYLRTLYIADTIEHTILIQFYNAIQQEIIDMERKVATTAAVDELVSLSSTSMSHTTMAETVDQPNSNINNNMENDTKTNQDDANMESNIEKDKVIENKEDISTINTTTTATTTQIIMNYITQQTNKTNIIDEWTRQCGTLYNLIYDVFIPGYMDGIELLDALEEMIGPDHINTTTTNATNRQSSNSSGSKKVSASQLKQQAFRDCAGDMGTAMKLLLEQAIPHNNNSNNSSNNNTAKSLDGSNRNDMFTNNHQKNNDINVFRCVLEFLLDLCDNNNNNNINNTLETSPPRDDTGIITTQQTSSLSSIAFFWPQLCHIHLRMLPATNATSLARIDLMEDFLLTVATKYSIHLALELVWSHTADLEESLQVSSSTPLMEQSIRESSAHNSTNSVAEPNNNTSSSSTNVSSACRRRRFAIIRFLCELESLLFDFDGGWGGGSVSLGKIFIPTPHQVHIMKVAMTYIQQYRMGILNENDAVKTPIRSKSRCLTRSARWDRLFREYDTSNNNVKSHTEQAQEKLQIAKHADYFSSHLIFSKRLADIAEKLRFLDVADRAGVLEKELNLLNASGVMGGDPLNRLRDHLIRVVRVPSTESHVFRSKERTPILLLMEIIDEKNDDASDAAAPVSSINTESEPSSSNVLLQKPTTDDEIVESPNIASDALSTGQPTSESSSTTAEKPAHDNGDIDGDDIPKPPPCISSLLEGASESNVRLSPGPKALKRFDIDNDPMSAPNRSTPKNTVQKIVSNAAEEQLRDIVLPNLDHIPTTRTGDAIITGESDVLSTTTIAKKRSDLDESTRGSTAKRISTLSTLKGMSDNSSLDSTNTLAPTGDIRRAVLTTIMMRGLQGNTIADGMTNSVQLSLKELERKRATELLLSDDGDTKGSSCSDSDVETTREKLFALGLRPSLEEVELASRPTEEDEVLEAIRLMLIQNQVAQGNLSPADAAKVLQHTSLSPINVANSTSSNPGDDPKKVDKSDHPTIDAGDVDPRLVGCGPLPPAVLQAMTLWKGGMVTHAELLELVKKDIEFVKHSILVDAENLNMLRENSAFWGRFAFGERWAEKKSRIGSSSPQSKALGWDLMGVIVKSNDDLRQEAFVMQLIELCQEAFELAELELWISPYRILATGRTTGVIECVRNAMSFDALKKRPGYGKGGLREHLQRMTEFTADPGGSFKSAQQNFVRSLAAYSLLSYIFQFKDRHNGNLLLDTAGHVIHIDFGFVFGIAPGGSFSLEMSTPFKLTEEMLDVMGGLRSPLFSEFVTLFCCGYLALQAHCETFLTLVEITSRDSTFKCFDGRDTDDIVAKLRERFSPDLSKEETVSFALDLIKQATTSYGTRQYDIYQYLSQGIY